MPELKNNFTGGKMNKDLDERLVPNGQYRDAWNVQVSTSDESDIGSLQNLLGNTQISNNVIPGDAVCVGSITDDKNNTLYLLLASDQKDMIFSYNNVTETATLVFVDINLGVLQYNKTRLITGINIVDDMLFWTDNFTEPKRINIPRSIEGTDQGGTINTRLIVPERGIDFNSGINIAEENITVIKKGPKVPPVLRLESSGSTSIKLYCGQPYPDVFHATAIGAGSIVTINVKNLIGKFYGNILHDYYSVGDTLYLKAVERIPDGSDHDLEDKWSKGVKFDHDIELLIESIGNTSNIDPYGTPIECKVITKKGNLYSPAYTVTNLADPDLIFEKKFPRFATRWKYSDGEYSPFSPFSQIAFSPGSFSYHPTKGFNLGMVNTLYAAHVEQFIVQDIPNDVVSVDILYREAGSPVIYVVDTISKNDPFIPGQSYNYWNSRYEYNSFTTAAQTRDDLGFKGTYKITSDTISKAIPESQTQRHWDNVPRAALSQEIVANRLVYGNYLQNYDLYSGSDNSTPYKGSFEVKIEDYKKEDFQLPRGNYFDSLPSIKSLRTYQVGIVYEDDYGRQTPVLTGESGVIKTSKDIAKKQHRLTVRPLNDAPDWATSFKYFIKETSSEYYNLAMDRVFDGEDGNVWLSFPSSDRAKVDEETYLILKKDAHGAFVKEKARYKILSIKNEAPDFIKQQASGLDTVAYDDVSGNLFSQTGLFNVGSTVPVKDSKIFEITGDRHNELTELIAIFKQKRAEKELSSGDPLTIGQEEVQISLRIINESETQYNGRSQWYRIDKIFNSSDSLGFEFTMEKPFEEDIEFSYVLDGGVIAETFDETKIVFRREKEEHKSWFDGRFFVKIERDAIVDNKVITTPETNWIKVAQNRLYYLHSGEGKQLERIKPADDTRYAGKDYGSPENDFNGNYELYGSVDSVPGSRIRTAAGADYDPVNNVGNKLEALIPQCGNTDAKVRTGLADRKFYTPSNNANRVMNILKHYIGTHNYDNGNYTPIVSNYPEVQNGFWYIDRTYYYFNNTTGSFAPFDSYGFFWGQYEGHVGGGIQIPYKAGSNYQYNRRKGMRLNEDPTPRKISIAFTQVIDADGYNGAIPSASEFNLDNYPEQKDFIDRLKVGTKVKFSDDQTGDDGGPQIRTITKVEGPFSIVGHAKDTDGSVQATPNDPYALRVGWNITFDKHFGNPVYNTRGYNPLYTLKDVQIERDDGTIETCPSEECTGGAAYPWATESDTASAHSTEEDHVFGPGGPTTMEIYEDEYSIGDSEKIIADSPVIWETEPKQDTDIDLYYEASGSYPVNIANSTTQPVRAGSIVRVSKSNPDYYSDVEDGNGDTWLARNNLNTEFEEDAIVQSIDFNLDINLGNTANVDNEIRLEEGTILDVIFKGTKIEVVVQEDVDDNTYTNTNPNLIRIAGGFHGNLVSLNWFNCYVFGEDIGVESDRIRDDFNATTIDNGPKVSTTVIEGRYKEERRKNGLIFSGIYNSMSGINNLNQFILGEGNIKELNPSYGSIQKLHTRDTDLITLCENKVLKVLASKDALFNADGNLNLTSSTNVLGQAVPFVGEYGISKNPESFASDSYRAYFTDAKRGAVLRLSRDGLSPIHEFGMRNWFADYFIQNEKIMLQEGLSKNYVIGSYDTKKKHYNVTFSDLTVSFSEDAKGWVSFKSMASRIKQYDESILHTSQNYPIDFAGVSLNNMYYTFREGKFWLSHNNQTYNNFYNYQLASSVNVVLNDTPEVVKSFNTLNYEGSNSRIEEITTAVVNGNTYNDNEYYNLVARDGWFVNSIVTDKGKSTEQHGMVNEFIEKEGKWFNYIKGDTTNINNIDPSEMSLQGIGLPNAISVPTTVYGCTDPNAINYNQNATVDDGSCITCVYGCTDASANNYDATATCDDGSCEFYGCTNAGAFNYDPNATSNPNNVCLPYIYGCLDHNATNYSGGIGGGSNSWCNSNPNDFNVGNNYTQTAFDGGALAGTASDNCCVYPVLGCTDQGACNYDPNADINDGSCDYTCVGCSDPTAANYNAGFTGCDVNGVYTPGDTSCCYYSIWGCTDSNATNYDPNANASCGSVNDPAGQSNCINGQYGDNCCCDFAGATVSGCADPNAGNYYGNINSGFDPNVTTVIDDGTCCYGGCSQGDHYQGTQPDIYGYCNNSTCTGPPSFAGCTQVGVCDPSNGIYTGCNKCTGVSGCGAGGGDCGYLHINYDPNLCYDCNQNNPNGINVNGSVTTPPNCCYDSVNTLGGSDISTCIETVFGCMDDTAVNYDPTATADDGNCQYTTYCCTDTSPGYCNYGAPGAVTPGNPSGDPGNCQNGLPSMCENTSCIGCIDPALGFHAGEMEDPNNPGTMIKVCRGTTYSNGPQTANLWQYTDPGPLTTYDVCSKDGTLNPISSIDGSDNRDGWNATNYDPTANLIEYWGMTSHNTNNLPNTGPYPNCNYLGGGCTDNGNMPNTYVASQAAVNSGYGGGGSGYVSGSLTPGQPAFNYNPLASSDDGSCYPVISGCQDPNASNTDTACTSGNFGWGIPGVVGDGTPWTDVNTGDQNCCINTVSGCTDNIAHQFIHTILSVTTNNVRNVSDGFGYDLNYHLGSQKGYIIDHNNFIPNAGAFNYDSTATTLQSGVWEADVPVIGYDATNIVNSVGVYSQLDSTCAGDPASCAGNGNETACCYQAGCLDPGAYNFEYNGFGLDDHPSQKEGREKWLNGQNNPDGSFTGVNRQRVNYWVEGLINPNTCGSDCTNAYQTHGGGSSNEVYHRTCADCSGQKAELFFVDPNTGASTAGTPTPGAYLSVNQVLLNADLSCCCYHAGCTDPGACNYYGNIDGLNSDGSSSYNPKVCQDDSDGTIDPLNACYFSTAPFYYADNNCLPGSGCGVLVAGSTYTDQNQCCLENPTACN